MKINELRSLTVEELNQKLVDFVQSPFFTSNRQFAKPNANSQCQKRHSKGEYIIKREKGIGGSMENLERNRRLTKQGVVVSAGKMDKTVVVVVVSNTKHPLYKKVVKKTTKFKAHDENNECGLGDTVEIMETRHISKDKYYRVVKIVEKAR